MGAVTLLSVSLYIVQFREKLALQVQPCIVDLAARNLTDPHTNRRGQGGAVEVSVSEGDREATSFYKYGIVFFSRILEHFEFIKIILNVLHFYIRFSHVSFFGCASRRYSYYM